MDLLDKTILESIYFETYKGNSYDSLILALKIANDNIIEKIAKTKGVWTKKRLNDLKLLIDQEIQKAYGGLFELVEEEAVTVANLTFGYMIGELGRSVPTSVVKEILESTKDIQGYTLKNLFKIEENRHKKGLKNLVEEALKTSIAAGVAQGSSIDSIIRDFKIESDNLSKAYIRGNINTFIGEARTRARHASYRELEKTGAIVAYKYSATLDARTTIWCRDRDQRIYKTLEAIEKDLHTHFNERSLALALTKNKKENARASKFGETTKDFENWFLDLPLAVQRGTLRDRQYEAFLKKKYKVKNLTDINKVQTLKSIEENMGLSV